MMRDKALRVRAWWGEMRGYAREGWQQVVRPAVQVFLSKKRSRARWFGLIALSLLVGRCGYMELRELVIDGVSMVSEIGLERNVKFKRVYYGRFSIEVPEDSKPGGQQMIAYGREATWTKFTSEPWTIPASAPQQFHQEEYDKRWRAFFRPLQYTSGDLNYPNEDFRTFHEETLPAEWVPGATLGIRFVCYISFVNLDMRSHAVVVLGDAALVIDDVQFTEPDAKGELIAAPSVRKLRERLLSILPRVKRTSEVLAAAEHDPRRLQDVVFVNQISLVQHPYEEGEELGIGMSYERLLRGSMSTFQLGTRIAKPDVLLSTVGYSAMCASTALAGILTDRLRWGHRTVDGIAGDEMLLSMTGISRTVYQWMWHEQIPRETNKIEMEMASDEIGEFGTQNALWDHMLDSVRWHGPASRRDK
jgi:hypothetical protein